MVIKKKDSQFRLFDEKKLISACGRASFYSVPSGGEGRQNDA